MPATRLILNGRVQGLGVRPTIFRLATSLGLSGHVRNTSRGVEIDLEGKQADIDSFLLQLDGGLPAGARVEQRWLETAQPTGRGDFVIVRESSAGPLATRVPVDLAVCPRCLEDVERDEPRRGGYPLVSCTLCGPRYSLIRAMPYERADTSMADFPFCADCQREYQTPGDRRFHAQTNACALCGPQLWCRTSDSVGGDSVGGDSVGGNPGGPSSVRPSSGQVDSGPAALRLAVRALREGRIVALRGLGGYQLLADATSQAAVDRLRQRKSRPAKPLAVLVASIDEAQALAWLDEDERRALEAPANPIVLLRSRPDSPLARSVHPGLNCVGLMLPTTPLHALLARQAARPLVCTSGNREGEPLEYTVSEAESNLAGICDVWLHHDRPIEQPIDDSVVRVIAGRAVSIRLARGLAPLALPLRCTEPRLALGGQIKVAAAWSNGTQAVLGPHIGDLGTLAARQRWQQQIQRWQQLYRFRAERIVHDQHPDYFTTQFAIDSPFERQAVQHHHAHVVSGMVEHQWLDRTVLGVAWDGTGWGDDGTIWGGELLLARAASYRRVGRLRPFDLPGGEAAVREPWRVALALLHDVVDPATAVGLLPPGLDAARCRQVQQLIGRRRLAPLTSSAGRLFDGLAVLVLGVVDSQYEGQPAMWLEAAADRTAEGAYDLRLAGATSLAGMKPLTGSELLEWDWRPLLAQLLADRRRDEAPSILAMRLHRGLAQGIAAACRHWPDLPVVLCGGVFQNQLLTELVREELCNSPQPLGLPGVIPPNDGGLAVGQLAIAAAWEE